MKCNTLEVAAPSPINVTSFSVQIPSGAGFTISVRSNNVFFDCYWQGPNVPTITRNFKYIAVPATWDDETDRQNFVEWVPVPSGTYALVEKY